MSELRVLAPPQTDRMRTRIAGVEAGGEDGSLTAFVHPDGIPVFVVGSSSSYHHGVTTGKMGRSRGLGGTKIIVLLDPPVGPRDPKDGMSLEWPDELVKDTKANRDVIARIAVVDAEVGRLEQQKKALVGRLEHHTGADFDAEGLTA